MRFILGIDTRDTQAGIKAMKRDFLSLAFSRQTCGGFLFDLELAIVAQQNGFRGKDLPVHFTLQNEKSTVRLFREAMISVGWITRIFWQKLSGHYRLGQGVVRRYQGLSLKDRIFLNLRWKMTPYFEIARHLPDHGLVMDLACGHGLLGLAAAQVRPGCQIQGIDHDEARINLAKTAGQGLQSLEFRKSSLSSDWGGTFDALVLLDSIHYFSRSDQDTILKKVFEQLNSGGILLMREVNREGGLRSSWNRFYEWFVTRIGFTQTENETQTFRSIPEWVRTLRALGFKVSWKPCGHWLFSDVLFIAVKNGNQTPLFSVSSSARITADDWGLSPAINQGILELAKAGVVKRVSVMVDLPHVHVGWLELLQIPGIEIGLHLNLTHETRFRSPLGLFLSARKLKTQLWAEEELARQLERLRAFGANPKYFDSHHHVHLLPQLSRRLARVARSSGVYETRVVSDPGLLFTGRFPLWWWSLQASRNFDREGLVYRPLFYPGLSLFSNPARLETELALRPGYEVIVHPSLFDDFDIVGCADTYRKGRELEFSSLIGFSPG